METTPYLDSIPESRRLTVAEEIRCWPAELRKEMRDKQKAETLLAEIYVDPAVKDEIIRVYGKTAWVEQMIGAYWAKWLNSYLKRHKLLNPLDEQGPRVQALESATLASDRDLERFRAAVTQEQSSIPEDTYDGGDVDQDPTERRGYFIPRLYQDGKLVTRMDGTPVQEIYFQVDGAEPSPASWILVDHIWSNFQDKMEAASLYSDEWFQLYEKRKVFSELNKVFRECMKARSDEVQIVPIKNEWDTKDGKKIFKKNFYQVKLRYNGRNFWFFAPQPLWENREFQEYKRAQQAYDRNRQRYQELKSQTAVSLGIQAV